MNIFAIYKDWLGSACRFNLLVKLAISWAALAARMGIRYGSRAGKGDGDSRGGFSSRNRQTQMVGLCWCLLGLLLKVISKVDVLGRHFK